MQLNLKPGSHDDPNNGVCIMEILSLATSAKLVDGQWVFREGTSFTDLPPCTHPTIARIAQVTWDYRDDDAWRRRLLVFLPRLLRARRSPNRRVAVRIALACAREVEHLAGPEAKTCNDTVDRWLQGEATIDEVRKARAAAAAATAAAAYATAAAAYATAYATAYAAYAATAATATAAATAAAAYATAYATAYAASAATATAAATAATAYAYATAAAAYATAYAALFHLLDVALDAHEKALVEEGEALWVPEGWEQEALEFVEQLVR